MFLAIVLLCIDFFSLNTALFSLSSHPVIPVNLKNRRIILVTVDNVHIDKVL